MKKLFHICLPLLFTSCLFAQDKKELICQDCIEIDYEKGIFVSKKLPFDQFITLIGKNNGNYNSGCFSILEEVNESEFKSNNSCYVKLESNYCQKCESENKEIYFKKVYGGKLVFDSNKENIKAYVDKFLRPNKKYKIKFDFSVAPSEEFVDLVEKLIIDFNIKLGKTLQAKRDIDNTQIEQLRQEMIKKIPQENRRFIKNNSFLDYKLKSYIFNNAEIKLLTIDYINQETINSINNTAKTVSDNLSTFLNNNNLKIFDNLFSKEYVEEIRKIIQSPFKRKDLAIGKMNFKGEAIDDKLSIYNSDISVIDKHIKNIEDNIKDIENWKTKTDFANDIALLNSLTVSMNSIKQELGNVKTDIKGRAGIVTNTSFKNLLQLALESFDIETNTFLDFQSSARAVVSADIGALLTNLNDTPDSWKVLPYLGMNLYLWPVNKTAPLKLLFKEYGTVGGIARITSLHVGVTMQAINNSQNQGIFNMDDKRGIIFGLGVRPWRAVRLSYGYMLLNRSNANLLNTSYNIVARPYFSISLDLEVRSLIPSIKNLFSN